MKSATKKQQLITKKQKEFLSFVEEKVLPFFEARNMKFNTVNPTILQDEWAGKDILITIPFGDRMEPWLLRAINECYAYEDKTVTIVMGAKINTNAWHNYVFPYAQEIAFVRGGKRPVAIVTYSHGAAFKAFNQSKDNIISYSIGNIESNINNAMIYHLIEDKEEE